MIPDSAHVSQALNIEESPYFNMVESNQSIFLFLFSVMEHKHARKEKPSFHLKLGVLLHFSILLCFVIDTWVASTPSIAVEISFQDPTANSWFFEKYCTGFNSFTLYWQECTKTWVAPHLTWPIYSFYLILLGMKGGWYLECNLYLSDSFPCIYLCILRPKYLTQFCALCFLFLKTGFLSNLGCAL